MRFYSSLVFILILSVANLFAVVKYEKKGIFFSSMYELKEKMRDSDFKILKKVLQKTMILEGLRENNYYRAEFIIGTDEERSSHFQHLKIFNQNGRELYEVIFIKKYNTFYINRKDSSGISKKETFLKIGYTKEKEVSEGFRLGIPLRGIKYVSSGYTKKRLHPVYKVYKEHNGIDFVADFGSDVIASMSGVVSKVGLNGGYGRYIEISSAMGAIKTEYGHLNRYGKNIWLGAAVSEGDKIGEMGNTGITTGPHLHFGLKRNGVFEDPRKYIKSKRKKEITVVSDEDVSSEFKKSLDMRKIIKKMVKERV